ncbi:MAG: demethoxyubiquinone hydroxylase family protein [Rickettsiales bacterium]|nr:demethoxyubiquinone hydroxylase family protein [Rickettsiales bacterium]
MSKLTDKPLPGSLSEEAELESMIRVNHAGEYGAKRIYEGQLAFIKDTDAKAKIQEMAEQEEAHLEYFDSQIKARKVRPTALQPLWHLGGYALGAATAMMGKNAAMACTVAVESVIDEHYAEQEAMLGKDEKKLKDKITQFRAEEQEHHATGLAEGAENAVAYPVLSAGIRGITKLAIELSKRV